jgi:hypothetical protein
MKMDWSTKQFWTLFGKIDFSVLLPKYSFICRPTSKNSGDYLAKVVAECLQWFGLDKLERVVIFVIYL